MSVSRDAPKKRSSNKERSPKNAKPRENKKEKYALSSKAFISDEEYLDGEKLYEERKKYYETESMSHHHKSDARKAYKKSKKGEKTEDYYSDKNRKRSNYETERNISRKETEFARVKDDDSQRQGRRDKEYKQRYMHENEMSDSEKFTSKDLQRREKRKEKDKQGYKDGYESESSDNEKLPSRNHSFAGSRHRQEDNCDSYRRHPRDELERISPANDRFSSRETRKKGDRDWDEHRRRDRDDFDAEPLEYRTVSFKDTGRRKDYRKERKERDRDFEPELSTRGTSPLKDTRKRRDYDREEYRKRDRDDFEAESSNVGNLSSEIRRINDKDTEADAEEPLSKRQKIVNINMKSGGAYIPPGRLRLMQEQIQDKASEEYQRIAWEALKKSIVGMTNKVNNSNIQEIIPELFKENIIRGRGVLARAIMQAQSASPTFTRVYAALVAIINTKYPEIGELILKRLIIQYKRGFRRNDKTACLTAGRFLAQLLNQEVAHEILLLEIVTHLLENPTDDSVEVAIGILKESGKKLTEITARGMTAITQRVRDVLHEGTIGVRTKYMAEVFFQIQKGKFEDFPSITPELDLVEDEDKFTHLISLDDAVDAQDILNVFKFDPDYLENEEKYKSVAKEILGDSDEEHESGDESGDDEDSEGGENEGEETQQIIDMTETNMISLRRKIYLVIQSSLDFEEIAHKLLKLSLKPGQITEMCYMILDCCSQQRTYEKVFGLLAQRFCKLSKVYVDPFTEIFQNSYKTIHRLETNKLRNVAKFFAHLLFTDAISWMVLSIIRLNEEETTSSSRIFIKILFQELCEYMGLEKLNERVKDVTLQEAFEGLFPSDHPHNTRFAINFFTSIGLGGLTDELREHLKSMQKVAPPPAANAEDTDSSESSSSSSSSSDSSSSSSSSSSEEEEDDTPPPRRLKKTR